MKFLWSFITSRRPAPAPALPAGPTSDVSLTHEAAALLRAAGCADLAGRVSVTWHRRLTSTAGLARPQRAQVLLNPRLRAFPDEVDRTLRHELAHLVAFDRARGRRITAHGPEWKRACGDLGIPGESRCHTLPLPRREVARRHVYRCPRCDFRLRRVRPIKARRRLACMDCCKRYAGGRFDRRFVFIKVAATTETVATPIHSASRTPRAETSVQATFNL